MKKYIFSFNKFLIWLLKYEGKKGAYHRYKTIYSKEKNWAKEINGKEVLMTNDTGGICEYCMVGKDWCIEKEV